MSNEPRVYNVLLVDDEKSIHESFIKIFENELNGTNLEIPDTDFFGSSESSKKSDFSIKFTHCYQGNEAINIFNKSIQDGKKFDLVICDIRMPPGIDGKTTLSELSKIDEKTIFLVCSAYSDYTIDDIRQSIINNPQVGVIEKPFNSEYVRELVQMKLELANT